MRQLLQGILPAVCALFLCVAPADAEYVFSHEELPDALLSYINVLNHDPYFMHDQITKGDPAKGDEDIRNIFAMLARKIDGLGHGLSTWVGFSASLCKIQAQSPGFFCGDDDERLSPADHINLIYVTTPVAAANNSIFMILSGVSPEGTVIIEFPEKGAPRVIYDYADKYAASNICVLDKDMSPLRSIYQMRVAGDGTFVMRESGNVPKHEGEEKITLVLSGDTCAISTETIIPF